MELGKGKEKGNSLMITTTLLGSCSLTMTLETISYGGWFCLAPVPASLMDLSKTCKCLPPSSKLCRKAPLAESRTLLGSVFLAQLVVAKQNSIRNRINLEAWCSGLGLSEFCLLSLPLLAALCTPHLMTNSSK